MATTRRRGRREVDVYADNSESACGKHARSAFTRMLADAAAGGFDVVAADHLDRRTPAVYSRQGEVS
jgi:DNA invertase Pin-like site-specific DNA recombinase